MGTTVLARLRLLPILAVRPGLHDAGVAYLDGERRSAQRVARRLFGKRLVPAELAGLAGAPGGASVLVGTLGGALYLEADAPESGGYRAVVLVGRGPAGPVIVNDAVHVVRTSMQRRSIALGSFGRQLGLAQSLGVIVICTIAGRRPGENGYYTWPRFGFDGPLPPAVRRTLPPLLQGATRVLDVMACDAGGAWWKTHGLTLPVAFQVAPQSRCRRVFEEYCLTRAASGRGPVWSDAEVRPPLPFLPPAVTHRHPRPAASAPAGPPTP